MADPKDFQGNEVCGEDSTTDNSPRTGRNGKDDYCLDGNRAAN